jgi:hypothetical protein
LLLDLAEIFKIIFQKNKLESHADGGHPFAGNCKNMFGVYFK